MDIWQVKYFKPIELIPNAKNPRKISQKKLAVLKSKIERLGFHNPVKVDENMQILGGNQRVKALLSLGAGELEIPVMVPTRPLTKEEKDEIIITDNVSDGEWDFEILKTDWDLDRVKSWGVDWDNFSEEKEEKPKYTKKIPTPIYEITGEKPKLKDLINSQKVESLISEIEKADISPAEKKFLKIAAYRHYVFDYRLIAEYYAHANKTVQDLMEKSALVIIDFNKAIENGYVELTKEIEELYDEEYPE